MPTIESEQSPLGGAVLRVTAVPQWVGYEAKGRLR
jgi:hypothetical protein